VSAQRPTIGFIGLGIMGLPMARNLLKAGYSVCALNRSPEKVRTLVAEGATTAANPGAVAKASEVLILMLPDTPDVENVVFGKDGVAGGIAKGSALIDMSTIDPAMSRRVAREIGAKGVGVLDAPVSGGEKGPTEATLSTLIGRDQATFDRVLPILQALGKHLTRVGEAGAGQITKACNQLIVAVTIEAVAEALALAEASGVDPALVRSALLGGFAQSKILEVHGERMLNKNFTPGFKARLHKKDLEIVISAERDARLTLPASELMRERMSQLAAQNPEIDHSGLRTLL